MQKQDKNPTTVKVQFEDIELIVKPDNSHEWLLETSLVAKSYGCTPRHIRQTIKNHLDEFIEGKQIIKVGTNTSHLHKKNAQQNQIYFTKRGVVMLGFFLRSETAKKFRRFAEDLIIEKTTLNANFDNSFLLNEIEVLKLRIEHEKLMTIGEFLSFYGYDAHPSLRYEIGLKCRIMCDELGIDSISRNHHSYEKVNIYPQKIIMKIVNNKLINIGREPIEYNLSDEIIKIR